jgi:hypothetical protein
MSVTHGTMAVYFGRVGLMQDDVDKLVRRAEQCRDLAATAITADARDVLAAMATEFEQTAALLRQVPPKPRPTFAWQV